MSNQQTCSYCQRGWEKGEPFCVGCGAPEPETKNVLADIKQEFYRDGYFIRVNHQGLWGNGEYRFYRGDRLVDYFNIDFRDYMRICEEYGLRDGDDEWPVIWDLFKMSQEEKGVVVLTFENDPKYKRVELRIIPWGFEICNAVTRNGEPGKCKIHGGRSRPIPHKPSHSINYDTPGDKTYGSRILASLKGIVG